MWTTAFRPASTQVLRAGTSALPANCLGQASARVGAVARRSFLVAPSYKTRVVVRGFATAKKTITATKTTTKVKKPAAKVTTTKKAAAGTKKAVAKKPAAKKKAAAKPKKSVVKKVIDPEKLKAKKKALEKRELKSKALISKTPGPLPSTAWQIFSQALVKTRPGGQANLGHIMTEASAAYKSLAPAELERLEETGKQNRLANVAAYKAWVETHPPAEIIEANKARKALKKHHGINLNPIKDDRMPGRSLGAYILFTKSRWGSGEFAASEVTSASKTIGQEWHALPAAEKKHWEDLAHSDKERHTKEMAKLLSV